MPNWSGGAQGAVGGALAGSALGPWGAVAGGAIGGIAGLLGGGGGDPYENEKRAFLKEASSRQAPQLGAAQNANYSSFRDNQRRLITSLEDQAAGRGPSVSREMLNQATNRNIATQNAMTAGGNGNQALMGMTAANNIGRLQADASQSAALGRVQEQATAQGQLGQQIWSGRSSDEDMNRYNTSTNNSRDEFNVGNQMLMTGMNDRARLGVMGIGNQQGGPSTGEQILGGTGAMRAWYDSQNGNSNRPPATITGGQTPSGPSWG